jgi:alpha-beta hydrolase superfamily lysophospholipase
MPKALKIVLAAVVALGGFVFLAAFVAVFLGDPEFAGPLQVTPEAMAAFTASLQQPYPAAARKFRMRDGTVLASQYFPQSFPTGSPTTILLVHGVLASSFPLNRSSGLLRAATGAEVVTIDLRGHGASGGVPGDVRYIGQYEDDLGEVVAQIRAAKPGGRVILAGHSMGGGIALRYALKKGLPPVDGYLLFAPHMGSKSPTTPMTATAESEKFVQIDLSRILGLALFNGVGITAFNGLQTLFFNLPKEMPVRSYSYRAMMGMSPDDYRPALRAIHQPLLIVVGGADEAFHADRYPATVRPFNPGKVVTVPGAGHDGVLTDPRTDAAVAAWLAQWPGAAGAAGAPGVPKSTLGATSAPAVAWK